LAACAADDEGGAMRVAIRIATANMNRRMLSSKLVAGES
jgi:hypothetical protein